jgi:hypothetical protein
MLGFGRRHPRSAEPRGSRTTDRRHVDAPQPVPKKTSDQRGRRPDEPRYSAPTRIPAPGGMSFDGLIRYASRAGPGDQAHPAVPAQPLGLAAVGRRYEVHQAITDCDADQRAQAVPVAAVVVSTAVLPVIGRVVPPASCRCSISLYLQHLPVPVNHRKVSMVIAFQ